MTDGSVGRQAHVWTSLLVAGLLAAALSISSQPALAGPGLFGTIEHRSSNLMHFRKWTGVLQRAKAEQSDWLTDPRLVAWQRFLTSIKDKPRSEQIVLVNDYANRVRFRSDYSVWGRTDHWATPGEFFANGGDCEDFVVAKYLSLRQLGFAVEELRLVVVHDRKRKEAHAVLVVFDGNRRLILDNRSDAVVDERSAARRYAAYYSINERTFWRHEAS